jgi:hypothetical protein
MNTMKDIRVTIFDQEKYGDDWPPTNALLCIKWFQAKIDSVPDEFKGSVSIDIDSTTSYDCDYAEIDMYYYRPETLQEEAIRAAEISSRDKLEEQRELRVLEELKKKYEG